MGAVLLCAIAIGKGTAGLFSADAPLHIRHTGNPGDTDLIHISSHGTGGNPEGNISIIF